MIPELERALELADLRRIIDDLYPDAGVHPGRSKQRIRAPWRGGDNPSTVSLTSKIAYDFKTGETHNAYSFLTKAAGYTEKDAAAELLRRAGIIDLPRLQLNAARRAASDKRQDEQREAFLQRKFEAATEHQRSGATTGTSAYLERKRVASVLETHEVAGVTDPTGSELPGVTFGRDDLDGFVQFALGDMSRALRGHQRIYDSKCLRGERDRDKDFIGPTKRAFVLLLPKGIKKLSRRSLIKLLRAGYEIGFCEGIATGLSVCAAKANVIMFCVLYWSNLTRVLADFRRQYGTVRQHGRTKVAVSATIWADNDAWGEVNTGLIAAHRAALDWGCTVRTPTWTGRRLNGTKPTDFNDLHVMFGLEAVRRSRKHLPDTRLAFAKDLGRQQLSPEKRLAPFDLPELGTALIVRAPMDTGKTHQLEATIKEALAAGLRVLVVVHRESLAKTLAHRLKLENYNDYTASDLRLINRGLVICFDSLHKLSIGGDLPDYDLLVLDECEQVLRHTKEPHIKNKLRNFDTLTHYLEHAPRFIGLDAHAGSITTYALARFAPEKEVRWLRHDHHVGAGRTVRFVCSRHDALDALKQSTVPTWLHCDSLKLTRALDAYHNDPATLTLNSETTGSDQAQAYMADPKTEARRYSRMFASPSVQTGFSDDSEHWGHVIGIYSGAIGTPQDAAQGLLRPRGVEHLTVYANPAKRAVKSQTDFLREIEAADAAETQLGGRAATRHPDYLAHKTFVLEQESKARSNFKTGFAREMTLLGYDVTVELPKNLSPGELARITAQDKAIRDAGMARYVRDRVQAKRIDAQTAVRYDEAHRLEPEQALALDQYRVRDFYRLADDVTDEALAGMLERDNEGKLRRQVTTYERFIMPLEVAAQQTGDHSSDAPLLGDNKTPLLAYEFYQHLGAVVGLNTEAEALMDAWCGHVRALEESVAALMTEREGATNHRKGDIDRELKRLEQERAKLDQATLPTHYDVTSAQEFGQWVAERRDALTHVLGEMPTAEQLTGGHILAHIGTWLRGAGLEHRADTRRANRTYAVTLSSIAAMWNLSRPRRDKWDFAQNLHLDSLKKILRKTPETPSETEKVSTLQNPKAVPDATRRESHDAVLLFPATVPLDSPARALKEVVAHMRSLRERPEPTLVYETAVLELVTTYGEGDQGDVYERYSTRLLDGTPVTEATADQLRVEALALYGWARDRAANGGASREAETWQRHAAELVGGYQPDSTTTSVTRAD